MLSGRYRSHIQDAHSSDLQEVSAPVFSNMFKMFDFRKLRYQTIIFAKKVSGFFLYLFEVIWWVRNSTWLLLGLIDTSQNPEIMEMMGFQVLPKWNRKADSPKWSRIITRSFLGHSFLKIYNKNGPRPPDPKSGFLLDFPGFPLGNQPFFGPCQMISPTAISPSILIRTSDLRGMRVTHVRRGGTGSPAEKRPIS